MILCFLLNCMHSNASDSVRIHYLIELKAHHGFILPHAKDLRKWATTNPQALHLDFGWYRDVDKSWEQCNCYAKTGLSFIWFDLGNSDVLGHAFNLLYYYEPLLTYKRRFYLSLKAGMGPSYLTKVYDEVDNPDNEFFSTRISYMLLMHLNFNYRVSDRWKVNFSGCYNHISNGGVKQPNRGMNFPTLNAGFEYSLRPKTELKPLQIEDKYYWKEKIRYDFSFYGTGKSIRAWDNYPSKILPVYGLYAGASKRVSRMNAIAGGVEWESDGYVKELMIRREEDTDHNNLAVFLGHELLIGKITFSQLLGIYFYQPYVGEEDDPVYQRYYFRYQVTKHFHTGITLKAHRHVAHIFDIRLGVNF